MSLIASFLFCIIHCYFAFMNAVALRGEKEVFWISGLHCTRNQQWKSKVIGFRISFDFPILWPKKWNCLHPGKDRVICSSLVTRWLLSRQLWVSVCQAAAFLDSRQPFFVPTTFLPKKKHCFAHISLRGNCRFCWMLCQHCHCLFQSGGIKRVKGLRRGKMLSTWPLLLSKTQYFERLLR